MKLFIDSIAPEGMLNLLGTCFFDVNESQKAENVHELVGM